MPENMNEMPDEEMLDEEAPIEGGEQDVFDLLIANASDFIHDEKNSEGILKAIQGQNTAQMVAQVAADILEQIASSASRAGHQITAEMALAAAAEIIGEIIELGQAAGVITGEVQALQQQAMQAFGQIVSGGGAPAEEAPMEGEVLPPEQPPGAIAQAQGV